MKNRKTISLILLLVFCVFNGFYATGREWSADRFLPGFSETTVTMPDDYSGKVVSTVVRRTSKCGGDRAILYIHGYNDYFFQEEMANCFVDSCWNFYAVDLRKYGRSLQDDQRPYEMRSISEYYPDIDSTLAIMAQSGINEVVLMGHSTGGLVAASYMNNHPSPLIKALILNSPFLDWNMSKFVEKVAVPMVSCLGRHFPNIEISQGDSSPYGESLLKNLHGEWNFDTNLKTIKPRKVTAGWIRAISEAQAALRNHSFIAVPILLMHSDKSISGDVWTPAHQTGDAVLDVKDISKIGRTLGPDITEITVPGGLHDLMLSDKPIREAVYKTVFQWLDRNVSPF